MHAVFRILIALCLLAGLSARAQTWNNAGIDWNTASNWNPASIPDTNTESAGFQDPSTSNPSLSASTVIQSVTFGGGAGSYVLGGGAARTLTLDRNALTAGLVLNNQSGNVQTFDVNVLLTNSQTSVGNQTATPQIDAGAGLVIGAGSSFQMNRTFQQVGGTLTINGTYSPSVAGTNFFHELLNGSTLNLNSTAQVDRPVIRFKAGQNATVNLGASQTFGYNLLQDFGGGGTGGATQSIYLTKGGMTLTDFTTFASNSSGHVVANLGARIAGGGNATINSAFNSILIMAPTGTGTAEFNLEAADGNFLNITAPLTGANSRVTIGKTGNGTVRLAGGNTYNSGALFDIKEGMLVLARTTGSTITGNMTIREGATVRLDQSNQIANSSDITLDGGFFQLNGNSEEVGDLNLVDETSSDLDFGSGSSVMLFASITAGTGTLDVANWTPGSDSLRFTADPTAFLSNIRVNGAGAAVINQTTYFEVVPEPGTLGLCGLGLLGLTALLGRKRVIRTAKRVE